MSAEHRSGQRGRPPDAEARRRVLALASDLLNESGYTSLTMDELAQRAGVSKKSLYRWWPNKAAIAAEAIAARAATSAVPDLGDTRRELLALLDLTREYACGRDVPAEMIIADSTRATAQDLLGEILAPRRDAARAVVQRGIARGDLPADVDVDALLDLWNGMAVYRLAIRRVPLTDRTVEQLVSMALAGQVPRLS